MSSSQGAQSQLTDGSVNRSRFLTGQSIRDSSDWTRYLKEQRVFKTAYPKSLQTENPWIPYGNGYRLTFLNGTFKCGNCNPTIFNSNGLQLPTPSS